MSVVIAIKENGKVYMASDSQETGGYSKITVTNPYNYKMWKTRGLNNSIIGHVGGCRDLGIIRYTNFIPKEKSSNGKIDMEFVQGQMVYDIYDSLDKRGFTITDGGPHMDSGLLFAYKDKIWDIKNCLYVVEIDDYVAIGSGEEAAKGSLASTAGEPVINRLIKAVVAASSVNINVGYPIVLSDTESCQFKLINEAEAKEVLHNNKLSRVSKIIN